MNELITLARGVNPELTVRALISMAPTNPSMHEAEAAQELAQYAVAHLQAAGVEEVKGCALYSTPLNGEGRPVSLPDFVIDPYAYERKRLDSPAIRTADNAGPARSRAAAFNKRPGPSPAAGRAVDDPRYRI